MIKLKKLLLHSDTIEKKEILENFNNKESYKPPVPVDIKVSENDWECKLGNKIFFDVEFFNTYYEEGDKNNKNNNDNNDDNNDTVFNSITNDLFLKGSYHYAKEILSKPIFKKEILLKRQKIIKKIKDIDNKNFISDSFKSLQLLENDIIWLIDTKTDDSPDYNILYDMVYMNTIILNKLNLSQQFLTSYNIYRIAVSPLIGILSPICYFIIPYMIVRLKFKLKISFVSYIRTLFNGFFKAPGSGLFGKLQYISCAFSLIFYFQGLFNSIELSSASYNISKTIVERMNNVVEFIKISKTINDILWDDNIKESFVISNDIDIIDKVNYFEKYNKKQFNLFSNFGFELKTFKYIKIEKYIPLVRRLYILDTIFNFSRLHNFNFIDYVDSDSPFLEVNGLFHPCIDYKKVVKNDISLNNKDSNTNNIIITGPNAGGKSTFIKSTILNILFAQTIGLSPCTRMKMTPFYYISSQINIPDCKGKESLFEAEMHRSLDNINSIKTYCQEGGKFSFLVMDEIFNSTNPIEGISGAYAICKKLSNISNSVNIISTHYLYLTKLAKEFNYTNYRINVNIDKNNNISYPYKIKKGISKQCIAIELLKENGFDKEIIDTAMEIKEKLLS